MTSFTCNEQFLRFLFSIACISFTTTKIIFRNTACVCRALSLRFGWWQNVMFAGCWQNVIFVLCYQIAAQFSDKFLWNFCYHFKLLSKDLATCFCMKICKGSFLTLLEFADTFVGNDVSVAHSWSRTRGLIFLRPLTLQEVCTKRMSFSHWTTLRVRVARMKVVCRSKWTTLRKVIPKVKPRVSDLHLKCEGAARCRSSPKRSFRTWTG